jgi:hypothetical protein
MAKATVRAKPAPEPVYDVAISFLARLIQHFGKAGDDVQTRVRMRGQHADCGAQLSQNGLALLLRKWWAAFPQTFLLAGNVDAARERAVQVYRYPPPQRFGSLHRAVAGDAGITACRPKAVGRRHCSSLQGRLRSERVCEDSCDLLST